MLLSKLEDGKLDGIALGPACGNEEGEMVDVLRSVGGVSVEESTGVVEPLGTMAVVLIFP